MLTCCSAPCVPCAHQQLPWLIEKFRDFKREDQPVTSTRGPPPSAIEQYGSTVFRGLSPLAKPFLQAYIAAQATYAELKEGAAPAAQPTSSAFRFRRSERSGLWATSNRVRAAYKHVFVRCL